jgi:acyl-coenzyme A thioesterase PaaI-like protein
LDPTATPQAPSNPDLGGEAHWEEIDLSQGPGSFVSGDPHGQRLRIKYFKTGEPAAIEGRAWFGPEAVGPPGHAHGGSMAAVLDEAMGLVSWFSGHKVVAAEIKVRFHKMLRLGSVVHLRAWVERQEGRKIHVRARLTSPDGALHSDSEGLFVVMRDEHLQELAKHHPAR